MKESRIPERLRCLRERMKEEEIDYYLIPTTDFHNSEYVSDYFKVREYFSGFTGSNGSLLVWQEGAGLWTDGRYFIQAEKELAGSGITLYRMQEEGVPTILQFLKQAMPKGTALGFDGRVISVEYGRQLQEALAEKKIQIKSGTDLADSVWFTRPPLPCNPIFFLEESMTGQAASEKLYWLRETLQEAEADAVFLTKLDEIMWLFNMRGSDVACNPVALSYAYVTREKAWLFLQKEAAEGQEERLQETGVTLGDYNRMFQIMKEEAAALHEAENKIWLDTRNSSFAVWKLLHESGTQILEQDSPIEAQKAVKTKRELELMREIYLKDSVAVTKFIYWLKQNIGTRRITEADAAQYLDGLRKRIPEFLDLSFPTISAYGANAAMMHYEADEKDAAVLEAEGMLLVDSGGQYLGGTTDVTRTILLGEISEEVKRQYSAVAAGMLSLSGAVFLQGCTGRNLDILAREPLWKLYHDYKCGTGHGVGYLLNVHEGPQNIRWKYVPGGKEAVLCEGMTVTDEPGIYVEGSHGIRIENVLSVKKLCRNEDGTFLGFETLTFVPIEKKAVSRRYMNEEQWRAFWRYQKEVYDKVSPYLTKEEAQWLKEETEEV